MQSLIDLVGPIEVHLDDLIEVGDGRYVACTRMVGGAARDAPYRSPSPSCTACETA